MYSLVCSETEKLLLRQVLQKTQKIHCKPQKIAQKSLDMKIRRLLKDINRFFHFDIFTSPDFLKLRVWGYRLLKELWAWASIKRIVSFSLWPMKGYDAALVTAGRKCVSQSEHIRAL